MKILSMHYKEFLKHRDFTLDLAEGMNIIRGKNEAGKTSNIEGLGYVLCGATALAKSVEDSVHWDAKSKSAMKVTMRFEHAGQGYTASRGASGAEVVDGKGKVLCTGHKPVTAFLENLLSIPAGRAPQIMLANQNEIRGVLALGPTAASEMIEKLADFSEIDAIVKRMVDELPNGKTDVLEAQIESAKASLNEIVIPEVPDHTAEIESLQGAAAAKTAAADQKAQIERDIVAAMEQAAALKLSLQQKLDKQTDELRGLEIAAAGIQEIKTMESGYRSQLAALDKVFVDHAVLAASQEIVQIQAAAPADVWEGDLASLEMEIDRTTGEISGHQEAIASRRVLAASTEGRRITSTTCPTCGHSLVDDLAVVEKNNTAVDNEIAAIQIEITQWDALITPLKEDLAVFRNLKLLHQQLLTKIEHLPQGTFVMDKGTIPYGVSFEYEGSTVAPVVTMSLRDAQTSMAQVQAQLSQCEKCPSQDVADERVRAAQLAIDNLNEDLGRTIILPPRPPEAQEEIAALRAEAQKATEQAQGLTAVMRDANILLKAAEADHKRWADFLAANESNLKETQENNTFIKAVKTARLQVSEKLWGTVMAGVSGYFSRFRGAPSVVTRTSNGFLVDGRAGRPSGSTLDILGLSLRIVIAKLFANSGLLVLDEVNAGCDADRTANIAGVLTTCGFEQIVWVTHSDIPESACDVNLIEL